MAEDNTKVSKSRDAPLYASEDASALGTNALGKPVSGKPKKTDSA